MVQRIAFITKKKYLFLLVAVILIAAFFLSGCAIPIPSKIPIPKWPLGF